jgi:prevent-host-death family protein
METVTMLTLRRQADAIVRRVAKGERLVLTYRGKPVIRLEPYNDPVASTDDPFYALGEMAVAEGRPMTNANMDEAIYADSNLR